MTSDKANRGSGFALVLRWRLGDWARGSRWVVNSGVWLALVGGFVLVTLVIASRQFGGERMEEVVYGTMPLYLGILGFVLPMGAVAVCSDALVNGLVDGSAAWVASKPVERWAYSLGILTADLIVVPLSSLLPMGVAVFGFLSWAAGGFAIGPVAYFAALLVMAVHLAFYAALAEVCGLAFRSRVLGVVIPLVVLFAGGSGAFGPLRLYMPWDMADLALGLVQGGAIPWYPLAAGLAWLAVLYAMAAMAVSRLEF